MRKLLSIDLFSGFGGFQLGLSEFTHPLCYCDIDNYAQAMLLSRMAEQKLPLAPIWTDVTTLDATPFRGKADIILGSFPCTDISNAGNKTGIIKGKNRSGLFFEIIRIAQEADVPLIFFENVATIVSNGLQQVIEELGSAGYDLAWTCNTAKGLGAPHKRERWFALAVRRNEKAKGLISGLLSLATLQDYVPATGLWSDWNTEVLNNANMETFWEIPGKSNKWQKSRIFALGNGIVPSQAREGFLMCLSILGAQQGVFLSKDALQKAG